MDAEGYATKAGFGRIGVDSNGLFYSFATSRADRLFMRTTEQM